MIDRGRFIWPIYLEFLMMMLNQFVRDIEKQAEILCQTTFEPILITFRKYLRYAKVQLRVLRAYIGQY